MWDVNFDSPQCIRYAISKALGLGIVLGGSIVKVPQIIKVVNGKSALGLSLSSYLLDTTGLAITVAYNVRHAFPWSTYGENVFLLIQNVCCFAPPPTNLPSLHSPPVNPPQIVITFLIVYYSASSNRVSLLSTFAIVFLVSTFLLGSPSVVSLDTLQVLAAFCIPLALFSKLPQIISNIRLGSTGQLSAFLVFNSLAGCLARVFTTATETGDRVLWWGFVLAALLNGVLALQMALYWNKSGDKRSGKKEVAQGSLKSEKATQDALEVLVTSPVRPNSPPAPKRYVRKLD